MDTSLHQKLVYITYLEGPWRESGSEFKKILIKNRISYGETEFRTEIDLTFKIHFLIQTRMKLVYLDLGIV